MTADSLQSHDGRWADAEIRSFGVQQLHRITLKRNKVTKVIRATAGHRWLVRRPDRIVTTDRLLPGHRLATARLPRQELAMDREGICHGFFFGDGSLRRTENADYGKVILWGQKRELASYFEEIAGRPGVEKHTPNGVPGLAFQAGMKGYAKSLPLLTMPPEYLYGWLAGYFAADGWSGGTNASLSSAVRAHLEHVRDICTLLGIGTYGITSKTRTGFGKESEIFEVGFSQSDLNTDFFLRSDHREARRPPPQERFGWTVVSVEPDAEEEVFCAIVPENERFALEDNILTMNCPFCGSGQITGRSDGGIDCAFCGQSFIVRVQPAFPGMPQAPGMGAPTDAGPEGIPVGLPPGAGPEGLPPGADGGMPPGGDEEGGGFPPGGDEDEEAPPGADDEDEDDGAPPFAKKSSRRLGAHEHPDDDLRRHLAEEHGHGWIEYPGVSEISRIHDADHRNRGAAAHRGDIAPPLQSLPEPAARHWPAHRRERFDDPRLGDSYGDRFGAEDVADQYRRETHGQPSPDSDYGRFAPAPPERRHLSVRRYRTISGDVLPEDAYIRHLAVLHSGGSSRVLALLRREAASGGDDGRLPPRSVMTQRQHLQATRDMRDRLAASGFPMDAPSGDEDMRMNPSCRLETGHHISFGVELRGGKHSMFITHPADMGQGRTFLEVGLGRDPSRVADLARRELGCPHVAGEMTEQLRGHGDEPLRQPPSARSVRHEAEGTQPREASLRYRAAFDWDNATEDEADREFQRREDGMQDAVERHGVDSILRPNRVNRIETGHEISFEHHPAEGEGDDYWTVGVNHPADSWTGDAERYPRYYWKGFRGPDDDVVRQAVQHLRSPRTMDVMREQSRRAMSREASLRRRADLDYDEVPEGHAMSKREQISRLREMRGRLEDHGIRMLPSDSGMAPYFDLETGHRILLGLSQQHGDWHMYVNHARSGPAAGMLAVNLGPDSGRVPDLMHRELGCRTVMNAMMSQSANAARTEPGERQPRVRHVAEGVIPNELRQREASARRRIA
jgi:hypothetical protein